jgi:hypothetical protein
VNGRAEQKVLGKERVLGRERRQRVALQLAPMPHLVKLQKASDRSAHARYARLTNTDMPSSPSKPSRAPTNSSGTYGGLNGSSWFCLLCLSGSSSLFCRFGSGDPFPNRLTASSASAFARALSCSAGQHRRLNWHACQRSLQRTCHIASRPDPLCGHRRRRPWPRWGRRRADRSSELGQTLPGGWKGSRWVKQGW